MPTVTLLTKVHNNFQLKLIDKFLKSTLKDLKVETEVCIVTPRGWVQVTVSGEDEKVALRYLADEIGLCPVHLERVEKFSTIKGRITALNKSRSELYVDVGVFSPNIVDATIPLQHLQARLGDGRKTSLKKLVELFGFCENLPLTVKIYSVDKENRGIEAMLSERQLILYKGWIKSLLDRLIILGASFNEVMLALKQARCNRDVVNIESLGFFEHAVVCKLGTDAVGLIPKIGKRLWNANLGTFNPREILRFLGDYSIL
ncbi:MAG: DUF2110 family protein [Candidatus Bathyarchaeia archaeon]|nr:DUF2110 family protein [Candidatus Bathyarchaeia archaeon]